MLWTILVSLVSAFKHRRALASSGESCLAAAARRPRSFRETSAPVELRSRILGALMQILEGLGTVSNGCEAGDRYCQVSGRVGNPRL